MDIVEQIKGAVAGHENEINQGIDSVGDAVDQATGDQYAAQVDQAQDFLKSQVENLSQPAE
ncbi:MAG: antitoxin [Propionicimonas sp.]